MFYDYAGHLHDKRNTQLNDFILWLGLQRSAVLPRTGCMRATCPILPDETILWSSTTAERCAAPSNVAGSSPNFQ